MVLAVYKGKEKFTLIVFVFLFSIVVTVIFSFNFKKSTSERQTGSYSNIAGHFEEKLQSF